MTTSPAWTAPRTELSFKHVTPSIRVFAGVDAFLLGTADFAEGVSASIAKRPAEFRGC